MTATTPTPVTNTNKSYVQLEDESEEFTEDVPSTVSVQNHSVLVFPWRFSEKNTEK